MKFKDTELYNRIKDDFYYNEDGKLAFDSNLNCYYNGISSLEGCPEVVNGSFDCSNNKLTSLEFCPKLLKGNFDFFNNSLTSLEFFSYMRITKYDILSDFTNEEIINYFNKTYPELMI